MNTIHSSSIQIPPRQRKAILKKDLESLKTSISTKGLFHPVVLRKEDTGHHLVAGERRLQAMNELHRDNKLFSFNGAVVVPGEVPFVLITDLSEVEYLEAELEENVSRVDLSWQELNDAMLAIHNLRVRVKGEWTLDNPEGQTLTKTGEEIAERRGLSESSNAMRQRVARAQVIEKHRDDSEVTSAASEKAAYAIALRKDAAMFYEELNRREQVRAVKESPHELIKGDLNDYDWPDGKFRLVIADPPYGMGADTFGGAAKLDHHYVDSPEGAIALSKVILERGFTSCLPLAHIYLFCDVDHFLALREIATSAGWKPWRTPIIWNKGHIAHAPHADKGFRREYEMILFATKGKLPLTKLISDVLDFPTTKEREHAAQKPLALYGHLIRHSVVPGEFILDPCCGSGTIFPAAFTTNTRAVGIELHDASYSIAAERLAAATNRKQQSEEFLSNGRDNNSDQEGLGGVDNQGDQAGLEGGV